MSTTVRMSRRQQVVWVAVGGAVGAILRYLLLEWLGSVDDGLLPWGTLAANLVGSLLLGFVVGLVDREMLGVGFRLLVAVGLLGGFTTFSFFVYENLLMIRDGAIIAMLFNIAIQVCVGILAAFAGFKLAARIG